jgi:hypothetical protein
LAANIRREALVELDDWDAAHPSQLFRLGENNEESIWEINYPISRTHATAHKLVFLGSPATGLARQSYQELTAGCGEGFLGKAKYNCEMGNHMVSQRAFVSY